MLSELRISGLGVIEDAEISLGEGLTVVTGETGAGKTMVVSGLGLILGARADSTAVRIGADRAIVEARISQADRLAALVDEAGGQLEDGELLVARQVSAAGRSRAFLGGVQVPVGKLAEITGEFIAIHGQNEQVYLTQASRQREILDRYAGEKIEKKLAKYRRIFQLCVKKKKLHDDLVANATSRAQEADMLRFGLTEIEKVDPQLAEYDQLSQQAQKLQAVDQLRVLVGQASILLSGDESIPDQLGADSLVGQARKTVEQISQLDPSASKVTQSVTQASFAVEEAVDSLSSYAVGLAADPVRLETITSRLAQLNELKRKYGPKMEDIFQWAENAANRLFELEDSDESIETLSLEIVDLTNQITQLADQISQLRNAAAVEISKKISLELASLGMPKAKLSFDLTKLPQPGIDGQETVQIMFSANPGIPPAPLSKIASGGELSRVRLALEVVIGSGLGGQTFIFDEIDAGIGGQIALEVGKRLKELAKHSQVIVVTHLAQVAAFGAQHYLVKKSSNGNITTSGLIELDEKGKISELARMMSGSQTSTALGHAKELIDQAHGMFATSKR